MPNSPAHNSPTHEEIAGATAFRDALHRFNNRLAHSDDSLHTSPDEQSELRELEREIEAKRTRHLLAAWKLREARQAFEAAQKEASLSMGQYRLLQNDAAMRMETIARENGEEIALATEESGTAPIVSAAKSAASVRQTSARSPWLRQMA